MLHYAAICCSRQRTIWVMDPPFAASRHTTAPISLARPIPRRFKNSKLKTTERHLPYATATVLPATRRRWKRPTLTPARQTSIWFTYSGETKGWVDLGVDYILRWFTCPQTITHPSSNRLIATRPGAEPTTSWSQI